LKLWAGFLLVLNGKENMKFAVSDDIKKKTPSSNPVGIIKKLY